MCAESEEYVLKEDGCGGERELPWVGRGTFPASEAEADGGTTFVEGDGIKGTLTLSESSLTPESLTRHHPAPLLA
jgi:hypothetical protein